MILELESKRIFKQIIKGEGRIRQIDSSTFEATLIKIRF